MIKVVSLTLLSLILVACVSNDTDKPKLTQHKQVSDYLDLTTKDGKTLPLKTQNIIFHKYWKLETYGKSYQRNRPKKAQSGCVQVLVGVNEEGKMSAYTIQKSYPVGIFDEYAIALLKSRRWQATEKNTDKVPVLTTLQVTQIHSGSANRAEATKECELSWTSQISLDSL